MAAKTLWDDVNDVNDVNDGGEKHRERCIAKTRANAGGERHAPAGDTKTKEIIVLIFIFFFFVGANPFVMATFESLSLSLAMLW